MKDFNPINRPIQPSQTLEILNNTYNTIEQKHFETIKATSELQSAMAQLDLNEAEDEFRQEKINEIKSTIEDNLISGNAYAALPALIQKVGDINSDPRMIGKLRAQADYKAFQNGIEARTDLTDRQKEYFKYANPYMYQDKVNDKGQIIGGSKWQPLDQPVANVPLKDILNQGLAWTAKEAGGSNRYRWLDKNDQFTDDPLKSVTGEYYDNRTGKWERLSKEKLQAGVMAAIETMPGAKDSLMQDYKIARWEYDRNGGVNPDFTDKEGRILTPDEYIKKRIDPFYKAATYYNYYGTTEYGNAVKAQIAAATAVMNNGGTISTLITTTNPIRMENFMPARVQAQTTAAKQSIVDALHAVNPDGNFDITNKTNDQITEMINSTIEDPAQRTQLQRELETITRNEEYLNEIKAGSSKDDAEGFDTYNAVMSMSELPDNKYSKELVNIDNALYDGAKAIRGYLSQDELSTFIGSLGGYNKLNDIGIKIGSKDGKSYVELPNDKSKGLYSFITGLNNAGAIGWGAGNFYRVDSEGKESSAFAQKQGPMKDGINEATDWMLVNNLTNKSAKQLMQKYLSTVNDLKKKNDTVLKGGKISLGQTSIPYATPDMVEIANIMKAGDGKMSDNSALLRLSEQEVINCKNSINLAQTGGYIVGENGQMEAMDSNIANEYTAYIKNADEKDISISSVFDAKSQQWGPMIVVRGKNKDGKVEVEPVVIYAPGGFDSPTYQIWNNDTGFRAKNAVGVNHATGKPIYLTNIAAFGNINAYKLKPEGNGFIVSNDYTKKVIGSLNKEQAVRYLDLYNQWDDTYKYIKNGGTANPDAISKIAERVAQMLASFEHSNNEDMVKYYYDELIKNLNN